ncbi:MAG: hypothetical protein LC121_06925 [Anaerolineae bacterium]|nr:hypothetical protein [Anaerolineae bacterium]
MSTEADDATDSAGLITGGSVVDAGDADESPFDCPASRMLALGIGVEKGSVGRP